MPKYFYILGQYGNLEEANEMINLIKTQPFNELRHLIIGEVEAEDPGKAAEIVKGRYQEPVIYLAIFEKEVANFQEEALLVEGRMRKAELLLFARCQNCHAVKIINKGPNCPECGLKHGIAGYECFSFFPEMG